MENASCINLGIPDRPRPVRDRPARSPWLTLFLALVLLMLFMFVVGPWGLRTKTMKPIADTIEEYGIEANAYYYTEVPEFADAQVYFSNVRRFSPK